MRRVGTPLEVRPHRAGTEIAMRTHLFPVLHPRRSLRALVLAGAVLLVFAAFASADYGPGFDPHG